MNHLRQFAIYLFTFCVILFIITPLISKFTVTNDTIKGLYGENSNKYLWIQKALEKNSGQVEASIFNVEKKLTTLISQANHVLIEEKGLGNTFEKQLIELSGDTFTASVIDNLDFKGNKEIKNTFTNYSSWLKDRKFDNKDALHHELKKIVANCNNSITGNQGFYEGNRKDDVFNLGKASISGLVKDKSTLFYFLTIILGFIAGIIYAYTGLKTLGHPGIKNDHIWFNPMKNVKWLGILTGVFLISFYVFLYWYPVYISPMVLLVNPVSVMISGNPAGYWFLYGFLYTLAIWVMGIRMIVKYRHSKYQIFRTVSVTFFQTAFAFLIPEILVRLNQPYFDFKNMWPLDYDFFDKYNIDNLTSAGSLGTFMLVWGIALFIVGVPVMTYFFGKRWYCSWVCGCGGLAETLGDPYRQLSDKSLKAWKFERICIHSVLVFSVVMTLGVIYTYFTGSSNIMGFLDTYQLRSVYGFAIGSAFSGVIGTGFYPILGNRVWCRFGCPLAAYLGIVQKFKSRYRITVNGGQCISCGNCSTYCEMGIDVRSYAQRGVNITRASCVGCGVCSAVCPRGVLNLENAPDSNRTAPNKFFKQ